MSLTSIPVTKLSNRREAITQLARHTGRIFRNTGERMLQDPVSLGTNAVVFSSLAMVLSRIGIANWSAIHAKNTDDGPYRYREAIRTTIREISGFTFGFVFLRQFQSLVKHGLKKLFEIEDGSRAPMLIRAVQKLTGRLPAEPNKTPGMLAQLRRAFSHAANMRKVDDFRLDIHPKADLAYFRFNPNGKAKTLTKGLSKLPVIGHRFSNLGGEGLRAFVQSVYKWSPIVLGSIPSVLLAGYVLERFTRDHSNTVVDVISRRFGGAKRQNNPRASEITSERENVVQTLKPELNEKGMSISQPFENFLSRVQSKQSQRLH